MGPPHPSGTPHRHPWTLPGHPWLSPGAHGSAGGIRPQFRNPNNNPIIVSILPGGAESIRDGGEGVQAIPPDAGSFNKKPKTLGRDKKENVKETFLYQTGVADS